MQHRKPDKCFKLSAHVFFSSNRAEVCQNVCLSGLLQMFGFTSLPRL